MTKNPTPPPSARAVGPLNASAFGDKAQRAATQVKEAAKSQAQARKIARAEGRPELTHRNVVAYLNWITVQVAGEAMSGTEAAIHMKAAELVISIKHSQAQGKATEHSDGTPVTA